MGEGLEMDRGRRGPTAEAAIAAAGMVGFGLARSAGWAGASVAGLLAVAGAFYLSLRRGEPLGRLFGFLPLRGSAWALTAAGALLGAGLGVLHRAVWAESAWPGPPGGFALVGAAVGAAEEVLYRGYVQGRLNAAFRASGRFAERPWREAAATAAAVVLASAAHTAYKAALFAVGRPGVAVDFGYVVGLTLLGGAVFGALRAWAGAVWPALAAHAVFDVVVYGDAAAAPWWVWR